MPAKLDIDLGQQTGPLAEPCPSGLHDMARPGGRFPAHRRGCRLCQISKARAKNRHPSPPPADISPQTGPLAEPCDRGLHDMARPGGQFPVHKGCRLCQLWTQRHAKSGTAPPLPPLPPGPIFRRPRKRFCKYGHDQWLDENRVYRGDQMTCAPCNRSRPGRTPRRHTVPIATLNRMWEEQGSACASCHRPASRYEVDHDHRCCPGGQSCGKCIRGLLCHTCNHGLGIFRDDPAQMRQAADYIERRPAFVIPWHLVPAPGLDGIDWPGWHDDDEVAS